MSIVCFPKAAVSALLCRSPRNVAIGRIDRVVLLLAVTLLLSACAGGAPSRPDDICSVFAEKRGWHRAALQGQQKWDVPLHVPMAIMHRESSFRKKARPPRKRLLGFIPWRRPSSAFGYPQALDGTWRSYVQARREPWRQRDNFADAVDFINWYIHEAGRINGISRVDAYSLYLNYHEGPIGFAEGRHKAKPWLEKVAQGVQLQSQRYADQYARCADSLRPGFWKRLWGW